jgi:hypothetical protein
MGITKIEGLWQAIGMISESLISTVETLAG